MKYQPPTGGAADDPYVGRNLTTGQQGSRVPPKAVEQNQRELVHLITYSGQTPADNDLQQVRKAIQFVAGEQKSRVFIDDTAGTRSWTVPAGVFTVDVELWGASAGSYASTATFPSGGAAAGGYARKSIAVVPGQSLSYTVGAGGSQGASGITPTAGGTSSFAGIFSATGGALNSLATLSDPRVGGSPGGNGIGGDINIQGQQGRSATTNTLGEGGGSSFGFYGDHTPKSGAAGPGLGPGAGGSGAGNNNNTGPFLGAAGRNGRVSIRF